MENRLIVAQHCYDFGGLYVNVAAAASNSRLQ